MGQALTRGMRKVVSSSDIDSAFGSADSTIKDSDSIDKVISATSSLLSNTHDIFVSIVVWLPRAPSISEPLIDKYLSVRINVCAYQDTE